MAWIELHQELREHPKAKRIARRLQMPLPHVIGHLSCLWLWCLSYAQDGDLSAFDVEDIADGALYEGDAADFHAALVAEGFIEEAEDGTQQIHDWHEYGGKLLHRKKANAERMKVARASHDERTQFNVDGTCKACAAHVEATEIARAEHVQNTCNARVEPEERRGEKRRNKPPKSPGGGQVFDAFWTSYPRNDGKANAVKAWQKIKPDAEQTALIMTGLERAKLTEQWQRGIIPHASTWLNQQRWLDFFEPAVTPVATLPGYGALHPVDAALDPATLEELKRLKDEDEQRALEQIRIREEERRAASV